MYLVNKETASHTNEFIRKWHLFCSDKTDWIADVGTEWFRRVRIALALGVISHGKVYLVITIQLYSNINYDKHRKVLFPPLSDTLLLKILCVIFMSICTFWAFSVSLTMSLLTFMSIALAEEFVLHLLIPYHLHLATSSCLGIVLWEQMRVFVTMTWSCLYAYMICCQLRYLGPYLPVTPVIYDTTSTMYS